MGNTYSAIYKKEKETHLKRLMKQTNEKGILKNEYSNYIIDAFISSDNFSKTPISLEKLGEQRTYQAIVSIPVYYTCTDDGKTGELELKKGDKLKFGNEFLEISVIEEQEEESKSYYYCGLVETSEFTPYTALENDLYSSFYDFFEKLGVEAIRHDLLFQNRYFETKENPYLLYTFKEKEMLRDSSSTTEVIKTTDEETTYLNRTYRKFGLMIRLYDKGEISNLDLILSKMRLFSSYFDLSSYKEIKFVRINNLTYLDNMYVIQKGIKINEKSYMLDVMTETHFIYSIENVKKIEIKGELEHE